jgi:hypothetical protein
MFISVRNGFKVVLYAAGGRKTFSGGLRAGGISENSMTWL